MGCHIWFSRPITDHEYNLMKEYALTDLMDLIKNYHCSFSNVYIDSVKRSIETGENVLMVLHGINIILVVIILHYLKNLGVKL